MTKLKIVYLFQVSIKAIKSRMKDQVDLSKIELISVPQNASEEERCEAVRDADIITPGYSPVTRKIIESANKTKLILLYSVGYDNIDVAAATENGIPVANNPGFNAPSVAEHTIMLILGLLKRLIYMHQQTSQGKWPRGEERLKAPPHELRGKILGLLGLGATGREVAKLAKAFGAQNLYYKRNRLSENEEKQLGVKYVPFDDLLVTAEILSIHVPLTEETRGMIGKDEISKMKDNTILVNTARGEIVDEKALAEALQNGKLSGAGIDVFSEEPLDSSNPLFKLPNVILTPHIAGFTAESWIRGTKAVFENINRVLEGKQPLNIINQV